MPKILMQGDKSIDVSLETALKAKEAWTSGGDTIDIGSQTLKASKIVSIDFEGSTNQNDRTYDLNNYEDKQIIRDFERDLIEATGATIDRPIEFYGEPIKEVRAFNELPKIVLREGMVKNDILGICHWSKVKYCLDNKFIYRYADGKAWAVYPEYINFRAKSKALDELNSRRDYAKKMDDESLDKLNEAKGQVLKNFNEFEQ